MAMPQVARRWRCDHRNGRLLAAQPRLTSVDSQASEGTRSSVCVTVYGSHLLTGRQGAVTSSGLLRAVHPTPPQLGLDDPGVSGLGSSFWKLRKYR